MKPRTSRTGRPHTAPEHGHATLTEAQQAKFLGRSDEVTMNLGHRVRQDQLIEHPLNRVPTYDTAPQAERQIKEGQRLTQGVYQKHSPINSGISTADNLRAWADYSRSNTYSVDGRGRDPKGRGVGSDGHLAPLPKASTESWADFRAGSESGEGRLEKLHRK
jgi:hypothetical protein